VQKPIEAHNTRVTELTEWRFSNLLEILRLYADFYSRFVLNLGMQSITLTTNDPPETINGLIQTLVAHLTEARAEAKKIGLEATEAEIGVTLDRWEKYGDRRLLSQHCANIAICLENEFSRRVCFILPRSSQDLYNSPQKGWKEILSVFPGASDDVEEMNICRAFGRDSAAVFHVLLVVEHGLIQLGKLVGVKDRKPGWDATCRALEAILKNGRKVAPRRIKKHFPLLELVNADIQSMKMAWRNKVSHADGKLFLMTSDFKPQVAEKIISACHGFMLLLATEVPAAN
jgi:hypothetical protein